MPGPVLCPSKRDLLRLSLGQLPADLAAVVKGHVAECANCRKTLDLLSAEKTPRSGATPARPTKKLARPTPLPTPPPTKPPQPPEPSPPPPAKPGPAGCPDNHALLQLMTGRFTPQEASKLKQHISACPNCHKTLKELGINSDAFFASLDSGEPEEEIAETPPVTEAHVAGADSSPARNPVPEIKAEIESAPPESVEEKPADKPLLLEETRIDVNLPADGGEPAMVKSSPAGPTSPESPAQQRRKPPVSSDSWDELPLPIVSCPDPRDLQKLQRGELPDDQAALLTEHVAQCSSCRKIAEDATSAPLLPVNLEDTIDDPPPGPPPAPSSEVKPQSPAPSAPRSPHEVEVEKPRSPASPKRRKAPASSDSWAELPLGLTSCPGPRDLLKLQLKQLPEEQLALLTEHVAQCRNCQQVMKQFALEGTIISAPPPPLRDKEETVRNRSVPPPTPPQPGVVRARPTALGTAGCPAEDEVGPCPAKRDLLKLSLGQLPEQDAARVKRHVNQCGSCRKAMKEFAVEGTGFFAALGTEETAEKRPGDLPRPTPLARSSVPEKEPPGPLPIPPVAPVRSKSASGLKPKPAAATPPEDVGSRTAMALLSPPQADDEMGRLGHYRILKVLGTGATGVVFAAEDSQLKRPVALKVMKPVERDPEVARQRFLREARAAAAIQHDHIMTIYQVGEDNNVPYLAMQLLEGETLDERLKRETQLPLADALRIAREVAEGLSAAHDRGLIHRDIKPANIWLESPRDRVKIVDFGLARAVADDTHLTRTGTVLGTPAYMAPEQARGTTVDHRCDLFALGCVLYRMIAGRTPFQAEDMMGMLLALAHEQPQPLSAFNPTVPDILQGLVLQLLAKHPSNRPAAAAEVAEALEIIEEELPNLLGSEGELPEGAEEEASDRPLTTLLLMLVLGLLAFGLYWFFGAQITFWVQKLMRR